MAESRAKSKGRVAKKSAASGRSKAEAPSQQTQFRKASKTKTATRKSTKKQSTNVLLRDVHEDVLEVIRARAERGGRSLQQELHLSLRRDARRNFDEALAIVQSWHDRLRGRNIPSVTELIREERER